MRLPLPCTLLLAMVPVLTGCGFTPPSDQPAPLFSTHINEEGSKRFLFEAAPLETLPTRLQDEDGGKLQRQKSLLERRTALQDAQLQHTLEQRGYCHQGFIVLSQTSWRIRGECNETASDADRQAFPNRGDWQG
ncbi:hypothetical protein [Aeromonas sobria]|uniref:hypothetical protein n=1 Tax=Aeromonas sobria TaxID=646 RepID=UPI003D083C95